MTTEKKEFLIPENIEEGVKILGEVKVKELIKALAPSAILSAVIFYLPISNPFIQIGIVAALFVIPGYLIMDRPIRRNIPVLYILKAYVRYMLREKHLPYRKEKYNVQTITEETNQGRKAEADSTKSDSDKSGSWRVIDNK